MIAKKTSRAGIDAFVTKQIRKSDKAPASFARERDRMRKAGTDIALDVKKQGKKLPWGLLFIGGAFLIAIVLFIFWKFKGGEEDGGITPGEKFDEPIDLKGRDTSGLLGDFGYKRKP